jgi:predicted nucleic acid-binding Zn ribbon protein
MADDVDATADRAESEAPYLLRASRKPEGPKPSGFCLWCEDRFSEESLQRFCNSECRNDYEYQQKRRQIAGLREG